MGSFSLWHWLIVLAVVLLLFGGRGKISQLMGDFGKGLRPSRRASAATVPTGRRQGQPGDTAKPIAAQATTSSPGNQAHQDSTAKV